MEATPAIPTCPRCGYDQSGLAVAWREACPLASECTECGLRLEWGALFRDRRQRVSWWVEGAKGARRTFRAVVLAPFVAAAPWWLWRRVSLAHPARPGRLVAVVAVIAIGLYLMIACAVASRLSTSILVSTLPWQDRALQLASTFVPTGVRWGAADGVARSVRWEWSRQLASDRLTIILLSYAASVQVCAALTFALLPISRRRAKVLPWHVVRAGLVGVISSPVIAAAFLGLLEMRLVAGVPAAWSLWILIAIVVGWHTLWWHATVSRYLRMEHAWAVALSVASVGVLAAPVLTGLGSFMVYRMILGG